MTTRLTIGIGMTRAKNPREKTLSIAVTLDTLHKMRVEAAQHDMSLSQYVYNILKLVTNNFKMLNINDIEASIKREDEK